MRPRTGTSAATWRTRTNERERSTRRRSAQDSISSLSLPTRATLVLRGKKRKRSKRSCGRSKSCATARRRNGRIKKTETELYRKQSRER